MTFIYDLKGNRVDLEHVKKIEIHDDVKQKAKVILAITKSEDIVLNKVMGAYSKSISNMIIYYYNKKIKDMGYKIPCHRYDNTLHIDKGAMQQ